MKPAIDTSSFRLWHLFVLAALVAATVAILVARPSDPVVAILLTLAVGAAGFVGLMIHRVIAPLLQDTFQETTVMAGSRSRAAVEREKTLVLRSIKELEFDRAMGKVSDVDFEEMGQRLRARAIRLMKQLDVEAVDFLAVIERELHQRLGRSPEPAAASAGGPQLPCGNCQTSNDADARFCKACGAALSGAEA
jgi:hypothetical protein